jgi:hypothetical protein
MKVPSIKKAVEHHSLENLKQAEEDLLNEENLKIEIEGADEGEKLTHILAAIWIKEEMSNKNIEFKDALRAYSQRVRNSIS